MEEKEKVIRRKLRSKKIYVMWKQNILQRDKFECKDCGMKGYMEVHHIKEFEKIMKEKDIKSFEEGMNSKELWDESNGITLCPWCHKKRHGFE